MSDVASSQQRNPGGNQARAANASAQGASAQGLLKQLRENPRIPLIIAAAAAIALIAVLLLWGAWAIRTAYVGWSENQLNQRQFLGVVVRFLAMYLVLTFFLLS